MIIVVITGCVGGIDVTTDPDFHFGYSKGQVYVNKEKLYLVYGLTNYLAIPGNSFPGINKYLKDPKKYPDIKGVLKEQTSIRIEKLLYRKTFEASYSDVYSRILTDGYKNELVKLNLLK